MTKKKTTSYYQAKRSVDTLELMKHPYAYALFSQIAYRAKRTGTFSAYDLEIGEALIGDYKSIGLTEQKYRTAKKNLEKWGFITTRATNRGTIAKIINSDVFDINIETNNEQANRRVADRQRSDNDQITTNKNVKNEKKDIAFEISSMKKRYDQDLIDGVFQAIASTRKSGKVAESVLYAQLKRWERYPVDQVEAGIRVYLEKNYAGHGKREAYLLGIIRNQKSERSNQEKMEMPHQKEITMDNVEELYEN